MASVNFSANDDHIIPSNNATTYRGLAGNDNYILSENTIVANAKITIVDTSGVNKIQLVDGLSIASSIFAADAVQLTLSNGAVVTINGASNFTFDVGGNATSGTAGTSNAFSAFAASMGVATLPASGSTAGSANVTVSGSAVSSSASASPTYTVTKSAASVDEGSSVTFTITASFSVTADTKFSFSVQPSDIDGTVDKATAADLNALSGAATIASGETSTTFTVTALTDSIAENLEGIEVSVFDSDAAVAGGDYDADAAFVGSEYVVINNIASTSGNDDLKGTSSDDDLTLTSADDVFEVTLGSDKIDGGEGTDTLVIDSAERIIYVTDKTGSYTGTPGRDFVYVRLGDDNSKYTVATNFEKIQTSEGTWNINEFSFVGYFGFGSGKTISNQSISNNDSTKITLSDHLYHINHSSQVGISYSIESDNDKLSDQILLNEGVLTLTAGSSGESYTATVTVTAKLVDGKKNIDESWSGATSSKTFTVTMTDDDFVDGKTGTSSDDDLTLTDEDDVYEVTTGRDSIDGGAGEDTIVVPSGTFIVRAVNTKGEAVYGNEKGDKFLYIQLVSEDADLTYATNFEYIQIKGEDTKTVISDYTNFTYFDVSSYKNDTAAVQFSDQIIADNTSKTLNLEDNFFSINENASLSYSVSFSNDKVSDQITLSGSSLSLKGGNGGDSYEVTVTVRATQDIPGVTLSSSKSYEEDTFVVTLTDDEYVEGQTGTSSDDIITLTSGDDVFEVTKGSDKINAGAGSDTILVPEGTKIISAVDARGKSYYTGDEGKSFLYIELKDDSTADGYASDYTVATNFEKIQIKGESTTTLLTDYLSLWRWDVVNDVDITNQSVSDNSEKTINLSDNFYTNNANATLNYTISFSNDKVTDQISVSGSSLLIQGGVGGDTYDIEVTVRATQTFSDNFSFSTDTFNYEEDTFTITVSDDDYVAVNAADDTTPSQTDSTTILVTEDIAGGVLLDLTNLNIDSGSAKITSWAWGSPLVTYALGGYDENYFFINNEVLKLKEGAWFDVEYSQLITSDGRFFSNVTDGEFKIAFSYKTNGVSKEHTVTISDFIDTPYGHGFYSDASFVGYSEGGDYILPSTDRLKALDAGSYFINTKSRVSEITEIFYSFVPKDSKYIDEGGDLDKYYQSTDDRDTIFDPTPEFKAAVFGILEMTSSLFNLIFTELTGNDVEKSSLRFVLWDSDATPFSGYATKPGTFASFIFIKTGGEDLDFSINGSEYGTIIHELGHVLGITHPFDNSNFGNISSVYNSTLYSVMAYADVYNTLASNPYTDDEGYANQSRITNEIINYSTWAMLDIQVLGLKYGFKANYNNGDNIYKFEGNDVITTIHDMGGYDTLDISDWPNNNDSSPEIIDLNGGAVFQVNTYQIRWGGDSSVTGQVITTSLETKIEKFIGSTGVDFVYAGSTTDYISTGTGEDIVNYVGYYKSLDSFLIDLGSDDDTLTIWVNKDQSDINSSLNINGGSGFDRLQVKILEEVTVDLSIYEENFDNFEFYIFTDDIAQEIIIDETDFVNKSNLMLTIGGDSIDTVTLPSSASQSRTDSEYIYYTLNNVEIAISDEMLIG